MNAELSSDASRPGASGALETTTRTGLRLGAVNLVCRSASVVKELAVAYVLGASAVTDAFALVMLLPGLVTSLVFQSARSAFLTEFPFQEKRSPAAGQRFAHAFVLQLTVAGLLAAACGGTMLWLAWDRFFPWSSPLVARYARRMLLPVSLLVVAVAVTSAWTSLLHARRRFVLPQLTSLLPTACVLAGILVLPASSAWRALAEGLLYGTVIQAVWLLFLVRRTGFYSAKEPWLVLRGGTSPLWALAFPVLLANVATQVNSYVDRMMAAGLDEGAVAVLHWASLLHDVASTTLVAGLLSTMLPHMAEQLAMQRRQEAADDLHHLIKAGAVVLLPFSCATIAAAFLFSRNIHFGKLDQKAVQLLAGCFAAYVIGLFAQLASNCLYQTLVVLRRTRLLVLLSIFANLLLNVILNLLLIRPLGAVGLALATSLVALATLLANATAVRLDLPFRWTVILPSILWASGLSLVITLPVVFTSYGIMELLPPSPWTSIGIAIVSWSTVLAAFWVAAWRIACLRPQLEWISKLVVR
ncbi:MAG: putative lipid II flippase MurJ [Pirellulaceae bacterium]|nr:MAG: putative lipid II flippase MurJ [Pirellulaceae bacterium]